MFHGSCHVDEIRRVYKECDYDINRAISVLIERQNGMTSAAIQEDLPHNIDRILERYGRFLDRESVETILRDNGNDYDIACVTIEQMYQISEGESP